MILKAYNSPNNKYIVSTEVTKNTTFIAIPTGRTNPTRYQCLALYFSQPSETPGGAWVLDGVEYSIPWGGHTAPLQTADGYTVYNLSSGAGSTECVNPEEWADDILLDSDLAGWISRHTKAQIEDLAKASAIVVDVYLKTGNRGDITVSVTNTSQKQLTYDFLWYASGHKGLSSTEKYWNFENYKSIKGHFLETKQGLYDNEIAVYHMYEYLDENAFLTMTTSERLLRNLISLTPTSSSDAYILYVQARIDEKDPDTDEIVHYLSKRALVSIPGTIESIDDIETDVQYKDQYTFTELPFGVQVNIHLDEEVPSKVDDDKNLTRNEGDDSPANKRPSNDSKGTDGKDGSGTNTTGLLTKTYALTSLQCRQLGAKIWSQTYFDVLKIQTNPIENIVSVKAFPKDLTSYGSLENITIGDVSMTTQGYKVSYNTIKINCGSIKVSPIYDSYLDYAPFTKYSVYVPYSGIHPLDSSLIVGETLSFDYLVDLVTGAGRFRIKIEDDIKHTSIVIDEIDLTIGIDVPLTSTDRAQADFKHLQSLVGGISGGAATGGAIGALAGGVSSVFNGLGDTYHSSRTSGGSPTVSSLDNLKIYIIVDYPEPSSENYKHAYGAICKKNRPLSSLSGFTKIERIDLTGIPMTDDEREDIMNILTGGFYI